MEKVIFLTMKITYANLSYFLFKFEEFLNYNSKNLPFCSNFFTSVNMFSVFSKGFKHA